MSTCIIPCATKSSPNTTPNLFPYNYIPNIPPHKN